MKTVKIIFVLTVIALLVAGPAAAGGKDKGSKDKGHKAESYKSKDHKDERGAESPALLLYPDDSSNTAREKNYREDPLYQKAGRHSERSGYVVEAGVFTLNIYNQGAGNRDETAEEVQLVVAINDLELFESGKLRITHSDDPAGVNNQVVELTKAHFVHPPEAIPEPGTPRLYSNKKFPRHGVYPAYYAEIWVGNIALEELAAVEVDIKGDPDNLLIHFDAYGRGSRDLCDDEGHGRDGKKGSGKKGYCDEKDRHGRRHDGENRTETFDIRNKLSHDVTQLGGTSPSTLRQIVQGEYAGFEIDVAPADPPAVFTAIILDDKGNLATFLPPETPAPAPDPNGIGVFRFAGTDSKTYSLVDNTLKWPGGVTPTYLIFYPSIVDGIAPLGNYSLKVCPAEDTSSPACSEFPFEVIR